MNSLRVGLLQLLYSQKLIKHEARKGDRDVNKKDGREIFSHDKLESFQNKSLVLIKINRSIFEIKYG